MVAATDEHLNWVVTALTRSGISSVSVSESRVIAAMILSLFAQPRVLTTDMTDQDQWLIKASTNSRDYFHNIQSRRQPVVIALKKSLSRHTED